MKTTNGFNVMLNRYYKAVPDYTAPSKGKVGINQAVLSEADTDLTYAIPITNGTINDDGDNQLTGSNGGDNTTDNTTTYKQGGGVTDATAQNLIANNGNATKTWTIADLSALGTNAVGTQPFGLWLYIKDATALAKFLTAGTCLEVKLGSAVGDYYSKTFEASDLSTGWNWITSNITNIEDLTETGTVAGNIDTFIIEVTTNNATDEFIAGDVIYDLLRQWAESDLIVSFATGYPTFDETNNEATTRIEINTVQANGFNLNGVGQFNTDVTPLLTDTFKLYTNFSKENTDEFAFILYDRLKRR